MVTKRRDEEVVAEYLTHFITQDKSIDAFEEYFTAKDFLNPLLGKSMLTLGDKDVETWYSLKPSPASIRQQLLPISLLE